MKLKVKIGGGGHTEEPTPDPWDNWESTMKEAKKCCPKSIMDEPTQSGLAKTMECTKQELINTLLENIHKCKFKTGEGYQNRQEYFNDIANGRD